MNEKWEVTKWAALVLGIVLVVIAIGFVLRPVSMRVEREVLVQSHQYKEGMADRASNSELKRWAQNGAVVINDKKFNWNEEIIYPIKSFVLFPKHPITLHLET